VTGLRGDAAIVGIAELPAEKRQSGPSSFTLDQYARLAKMVIDDAGVDPAMVTAFRRTVSPSQICSPRPHCPSTWVCR
jgi:hypothetical protein